MIHDCFLYNGETAMVDIQKGEYGDLKLISYAIGGNQTFTGKPTNLPFPSCNSLSIANLDAGTTPWEREALQRNHIHSLLTFLNASDTDIVIIRDADEIFKWSAVKAYIAGHDGICCLQMDEYHFYLNTVASRQSWRHPKIMRWRDLKNRKPNDVRAMGGPVIENAGWHFSWQGDVNAMMKKFQSFSHQEPEVQKMANPGILRARVDNLYHLFTNEKLSVVGTGVLPVAVQLELEKYTDNLYRNEDI